MWPDRRLKQKVQPVEKIDENVEKIWSELILWKPCHVLVSHLVN